MTFTFQMGFFFVDFFSVGYKNRVCYPELESKPEGCGITLFLLYTSLLCCGYVQLYHYPFAVSCF